MTTREVNNDLGAVGHARTEKRFTGITVPNFSAVLTAHDAGLTVMATIEVGSVSDLKFYRVAANDALTEVVANFFISGSTVYVYTVDPAPILTGNFLLRRETVIDQTSDEFVRGTDVAEPTGKAVDKLTRISQEQQEEIDKLEGRLGTQEGHDADARLQALETAEETQQTSIDANTDKNAEQDTEIATLKTEQTTQNTAIAANTNRQTEISANTTRSTANAAKNVEQDASIAANTARQTEISANTTRSTANAAKNVQQDRRLDKVEDGFMQGAGPIPLVCAVKHNNELTNEPTPNGNAAANSPAFPTGFGIDFTTKMATGLTTPIDPDTIAVGEVPDNFFSNWMNSSSTFVSEYRARKAEFDLYVVYVHGDPVNDKGATGYGVPDIRPAFAEKADQDVVIVQSTGVPAGIVMQAWVDDVELASINLVLDTYGLTFTNAGLVASSVAGIVDPRHADQGGFVRGLAEIPADQEKNRLVEFTLGVPEGTAFEPAVVYELRALESTLRTVDRLSPTELRQQFGPTFQVDVQIPMSSDNFQTLNGVYRQGLKKEEKILDAFPLGVLRKNQRILERPHGDIIFSVNETGRGPQGSFEPAEDNQEVSYRLGFRFSIHIADRSQQIVRDVYFLFEGNPKTGLNGFERRVRSWGTFEGSPKPNVGDHEFSNNVQAVIDSEFDMLQRTNLTESFFQNPAFLTVEAVGRFYRPQGQILEGTGGQIDGLHISQGNILVLQHRPSLNIGEAATFNAPVQHSIYIQVDAAAGGATPSAPAAPSNLIMQFDNDGEPTEENPAESLRTLGGDPLTSVMAGGVAFSPEPKAHVAGKFLFKYTGFARPTATNKRISEVIEYSVGIPQTGEADLPIRRLYYYLAIADGDAIQATRAYSFNLSTQTSPNVVAVPSPTATQRVVRYSRDFTNAEQRSDAANTATSWTFTNPVIVNAIDGRAGPSQTTPRDVLRYPSESTVIAEDHTVVADDGGRMIQGPKVGDASEQEGGTLVVRREDGSVAGAGNARTVVDLLPTASKETVITERMFHEITLSTPFAKIENNLYVPLFDEIRLFFGSGPAIDSEQVIVLDLYRMRFQADTVTRNEYVKLISRPYNNTAGSRLEIELNRQGTDPNFTYDFLRLYLSEDSAFSLSSNKLLEVLGIKYNEEILPAPVFSLAPVMYPVTGQPIETPGVIGDLLNDLYIETTELLSNIYFEFTVGETNLTVEITVEGFAQRQNQEDELLLYVQVFDLYGESVFNSAEDFKVAEIALAAPTPPATTITERLGLGLSSTDTAGGSRVVRSGKRVEIFVAASPNNEVDAAGFSRRLVLSNIPLDEGAYRFVTWGRASAHGDATAMYRIGPNRPILQSFASSTLFESPREHTKTTSPNQAEIEGRQVLSLRPNRWHFGNQFSDGENVYFGVEPHIRLPHTLFVPDVYNNNIDNDNTHNRIKIFFPWVDLEKLESITLAAQGLPTATLWHRTTVLDDPFFKLVRVEASADTRWVEMALLESTLATGSGYVGTHLQMNIVGDA